MRGGTYTIWTDAQLAALRRAWGRPNWPAKRLAKLMGKTPVAVMHKAGALGLPPRRHRANDNKE